VRENRCGHNPSVFYLNTVDFVTYNTQTRHQYTGVNVTNEDDNHHNTVVQSIPSFGYTPNKKSPKNVKKSLQFVKNLLNNLSSTREKWGDAGTIGTLCGGTLNGKEKQFLKENLGWHR
jgi:hypothetical protein